MPICTITGLPWKQPECPHPIHWPHPALAMGTTYTLPENPTYRSYILMLGASLSELVRNDRAVLRAAISRDGKRFPQYCSIQWLTLNLERVQEKVDFICSLTPTMAKLYPSLIIDPNLRLDTWLNEVSLVQDELKHASNEFMIARQLAKDNLALSYAAREAKLIAAMTGSVLRKEQDIVRAAYIESVIAASALDEDALDRLITINPLTIQNARNILTVPDRNHSALSLKEAMLFVEMFAPHSTVGEYEQYRALILSLDKALARHNTLIEMRIPSFTKQEAKIVKDNAVLSELQKRLAALTSRTK